MECKSGDPQIKIAFQATSHGGLVQCLAECIAGRPTFEDVEAIQSPFAADMLESLPCGDPISLADMFPHASPDAIDLMSRLLHFNPEKRITAQEALEHPYVRQFHDPSQEPDAPYIITVPINDNTKVRRCCVVPWVQVQIFIQLAPGRSFKSLF